MSLKIWLFSLSFIMHSFVSKAVLNDGKIDGKHERSIATSVVRMMELLETEEEMVMKFRKHAIAMEKKLKTIESELKRRRRVLAKAEPNAEAFLLNPINAFSLINRMQDDWLKFESYLREPIMPTLMDQSSDAPFQMATETDLKEAIGGLREIQIAYNLASSDIAAGILNGKQYDAQLSSLDLYTIGYELFKQNFSYEASVWLDLALEAYNSSLGNRVLDFSKSKIYDVYSLSLLKNDDFFSAARMLEEGMQLDEKNTKLFRNFDEIERIYLSRKAEKEPVPITHVRTEPEGFLGCAGELPMRPNSLHCLYNSETNDFLKLAPIKMEEISLDPYMVLYYDVISDREIDVLKELSRKDLKRAMVYNERKKREELAFYRTSQTTWLDFNLTAITQRLDQRIHHMTGFETMGSEPFEIMNYGLGGHYKQHHDYFKVPVNDKSIRQTGNRKATVIFYLSDVEQGGATVFPHLKIAIFPQKGAALMWHNLNNKGDPDWRTLHAGCPVIVGSKWLATKWIRERNQFRSSPCLQE